MANAKVLTLVAVIAVIAVIGAAVFLMGDQKIDTNDKVLNDGYVFEVDTVAKVYGNANNDDKIDKKDIDLVQKMIDGKETVDLEKYPFADAYKDGKIDQKDIDQINMIINNEKGQVWYQNYYGESQKIEYPLLDKKIGLTYWQQAQLVDLVGHWDDVVAANASITQARSNQYDLSNIVYRYGTTGSSKLTEEFCEGYLQAGVNLIIGSPYKATVTEVAAQYLPDVPVITLGIGGASCVSSALTLGILMDAEDKAENYEKYVLGIMDDVQNGLKRVKNSEKPTMLVCRMYEDNDSYISKYGGILVNCAKTDGSYQLLSMFADLYTDNSETSTTPSRTQEWILSQDFDLILDMEVYTGFQTSSIEGEQFYTPGEYNKRFENSVRYFKGTSAFDDGGVLSSSYIFDGYSGFASLMMSAYMIYPDHFSLKEGQDSLQYWYDNFTETKVDVTTQGGYYYTGEKYKCQFMDKEPTLANGFYSWNPTMLRVSDNYSNCTPAFMTIAEEAFKAVYGDVPSYDGIKRSDIPSKYLYKYSDYTSTVNGKLVVKTFDNTSDGKSEAYADKTLEFTPTKVICYTDAYIDTIYHIFCDYYGEKPYSGNDSKSQQALWDLIPAMTSSVKSNLEKNYKLTVPEKVTIINTSQEDLTNYCGSISSKEKVIIFMSEYNIRSTNKSTWWGTNTAISENNPNIQFVYLLSNSPAMVLSTTEMIGEILGYNSTEAMMTKILAEIYVMQKAIDDKGKTQTFYVETAAKKAVASNTLMGGIFDSILKMTNIVTGDNLMNGTLSDEAIIDAKPTVLAFYKSDSRSDDDCMRVL